MATEGLTEELLRRGPAAWAQVVVVGGGPAGAVAATLLARAGVRVALVHRPSGGGLEIGEVLPPAARPTLRRLGLGGILQDRAHLPSPGTVSAWGSEVPRASDFLYSPYGDGLHLDRARFDAALRDLAVAAGARLVTGTWDVRGRGSAAAEDGTRPVIVDCTGRAAAVARANGALIDRRDLLVAVAGVLEPASSSAAGDVDARTYVESVRDGWWYSALLPDGRRIAAFHTDADLLSPAARLDPAVWHANLSRAPVIGSLVHATGGLPPKLLRVLAADTRRLTWPTESGPSGAAIRAARDRQPVAAGDAAMAFDPLSSQGILSAIQSAEEAVPEILARVSGDDAGATERSGERVEKDGERWSRYLERLTAAYADEQRWPDAPFWQRRHRRPWDAESGLAAETVPFGSVDRPAGTRS